MERWANSFIVAGYFGEDFPTVLCFTLSAELIDNYGAFFPEGKYLRSISSHGKFWLHVILRKFFIDLRKLKHFQIQLKTSA